MSEFYEMSYEEIKPVINEINDNSREIRLSLGVVDYDAPYLLYYDVLLSLPSFCNPKQKVRDFLSRIDMLQSVTILEQK